jgi:hypothetical protein
MEILYKNLSGKPSLTAGEADIVYSAIVDAYQKVIQEYGVANFRFQVEDVTVDTTSGTNYVDLDEYVYKVVSGSVRIPAEDTNLALIDEVSIFQHDPRAELTDVPTSYAYKNSGDPNIMRLRLYPTPNAVFTIYLQVLKFPSDAMTNFPTELMAAIKNKAKSLSCLGLGLAQYQVAFDREYEKSIAQIKDGYSSDGPIHVKRSFIKIPHRSVESRIPN